MKIKEGLVLREAAGSYVVMSIGGELSFNGMLTVNETGVFIWKCIEDGKNEAEITEMICGEYDIDRDTAAADVRIFIKKMKEAGVLE